MGKITIFGAGYASLHPPIRVAHQRTNVHCQSSITGLSTAHILSQNNPSHAITIVARELPGFDPSDTFASPWYVQQPELPPRFKKKRKRKRSPIDVANTIRLLEQGLRRLGRPRRQPP
jgi:hypothetical protein